MSKPGYRTAIELRLEQISLYYGAFRALEQVSFTVPAGTTCALLGPSGCGKSSLLRTVGGLVRPSTGEVYFDKLPMSQVAPHRRNVGFVFQDYALFPHLTVAGNIRFGLRMHGVPRAEWESRLADVLDLLQISALREAHPNRLSGGQQQRVALARTLVVRPAMLLLDEPLSALDRQLRDEMRNEFRKLLRSVGITTLIVTHDQDEALALADRIVVMRNGGIEQIGSPRDIYRNPRTRFVAAFVGETNFLQCRPVGLENGRLVAALFSGERIRLPAPGTAPSPELLEVTLRPEQVEIGRVRPGNSVNVLQGKVSAATFFGSSHSYEVTIAGGDRLIARVPATGRGDEEIGIGEQVFLSWPTDLGGVVSS